jgi:hypothetical protein
MLEAPTASIELDFKTGAAAWERLAAQHVIETNHALHEQAFLRVSKARRLEMDLVGMTAPGTFRTSPWCGSMSVRQGRADITYQGNNVRE